MSDVRGTIRRRWRPIAAALVALLVLALGTSALGGPSGDMVVAAQAPTRGDSMTVVMSQRTGLFGGDCDGTADLEIRLDDAIILTRGIVKMLVSGCRGQVEVPYSLFAVANDQFEVVVDYKGQEESALVSVRKTVEWVYVRSFSDENVAGQDRVRIDAALGSVRGQPLNSGIFTSGELHLDVFLERCEPDEPLPIPNPLGPVADDCPRDRDLHQRVYTATFPIENRPLYVIVLPFSEFANPDDPSGRAKEGLYNVTATFNNFEAAHNTNVPMDPTVFREDPPANWFRLEWTE